jgi:hypothetical protein
MTKTKKRLIAIIVSVALVLGSLTAFIVVRTVRNNRPPVLENIRARLETLIDLSGDLNQILWGEGLPTYPRVTRTVRFAEVTNRPRGGEDCRVAYYTFPDATHGTVLAYQYYVFEKDSDGDGYVTVDLEAEAAGETVYLQSGYAYYRYATAEKEEREGFIGHNAETGVYYYPLEDFTAEDEPYYYTASDDPDYEYVREDSGYLSIADIRDEVKLVFSAAIVAEIEQAVFTGVTAFEGNYGTSYPRYRDIEGKDNSYRLGMTDKDSWGSFTLTEWVYDYETLALVKPSKARSITVSVECYPKDDPTARETREIKFVLENGQWFLDSYTR